MRNVIKIFGIVCLTMTGCGDGYVVTDNMSDGDLGLQEMLPIEGETVATYLAAPPDRAIENQYIVVLKNDSVETEVEITSGMRIKDNPIATIPFKAQAVNTIALEMASTYNAGLQLQYHSAIAGFVTRMTHREMEEMLKDPRIAFIEQDQTVSISATQSGATWGIDRIDQASLPLNGKYSYNYDGSGVDAYIIDTGIRRSHNDFGGRVSNGYSAINDGRGSQDCNGHGTHVAGTVGGSTWGVAKKVNLIPVRVLGCDGSGDYSQIIAGVDWVKRNASGPSVANMSLGGGDFQSLDNAVKSAIASGINFVVAAGNDNANACYGSPNKVREALTIGSSMSNDRRSSFSNWGSCIDMFAPGSEITSAYYTSNSSTYTMSGTSMAAPHVAGVVALYLDQNPSATPTQVENALISAAVSNRISDARGSPNRLVQSILGEEPGGGGGPEPIDTMGRNIWINRGTWARTSIPLESGYSNLIVEIWGGTGNADLYVNYGRQSRLRKYLCRPKKSGNNEVCNFSNPKAGRWHIDLRGKTKVTGLTLRIRAN